MIGGYGFTEGYTVCEYVGFSSEPELYEDNALSIVFLLTLEGIS